MKYRLLALFPLAFAGAFAAVALGALGALGTVQGEALTSVLTAENEAGKLIAFVGCFAAALAFERGDYLQRAWFTNGACYLLLLAGDATGVPSLAGRLSIHQLGLAQGTLAVVANAASVVGTWMLARAWSVAGFEDEEDAEARARRRMLFAGAAVLSLAITGWSLVHDARALVGGDLASSVSIASDLGDTICLALVAPVMMTALALRGGLLRWPWGLLAASGVAWLVFDAASGIVDASHVGSAGWRVATEGCRALACAWVFSAGMAQRMVVAPDARPSVPPPET
jgi:hypothetical protein